MRLRTHHLASALLVAGLAGTLGLGARLAQSGALDREPNLLWLKRSPYGRTIAYAMRGPADLYWHRGGTEEHDELHEEETETPLVGDEEANPMARLVRHATDLKREFDEHEAEHEAEEHAPPPERDYEGPRDFLLTTVRDLNQAYYSRTNDMGDTALAWAFMKGEAQKRLRLSYEMDPTNLICYGSYFLFLSESIARVHGADAEEQAIRAGREEALQLSRATVSTCLEHQDEPTAMITATSAAHDAVTLLLKPDRLDLRQARDYHLTSVRCLERYNQLREAMIADGSWENFSPYRRQEMEDAHELLALAVEADRYMIERIENGLTQTPVPLRPE